MNGLFREATAYPSMVSIIIQTPDDLAAGLRSQTWTIEEVYLEDKEHREEVRSAIKEAFEPITGGGHYVYFSDEIA